MAPGGSTDGGRSTLSPEPSPARSSSEPGRERAARPRRPAARLRGRGDGAAACPANWSTAGKLTRYQADAVLGRRFGDLRMGNYEILDRLGAGGMGTVFKARHRRMKRVVALKVLSREVAGAGAVRRPVPARGRDDRPADPPEHRDGVRRRRGRGRAVPGDGVRQRPGPGVRGGQQRAAAGGRRGRPHPPGGPRAGVRPRPGDRPPGHQAGEPPPRRGRGGQGRRPRAGPAQRAGRRHGAAPR